jgi:TRAP-type C4-dicarboxylate transport system permease small subunit
VRAKRKTVLRFYEKIADRLSKLLEYIVGGFLIVIATTAFAQVFTRYVLRNPLLWTHELDILLMIWAVWLGAAIGIHRKAHLRITFISEQLSVAKQRALVVFVDLSALFLLIIIGVAGIKAIQSLEGMALISMPIPRGWMVAAAPVGAILMILLYIPALVGDLKAYSFILKTKREN